MSALLLFSHGVGASIVLIFTGPPLALHILIFTYRPAINLAPTEQWLKIVRGSEGRLEMGKVWE